MAMYVLHCLFIHRMKFVFCRTSPILLSLPSTAGKHLRLVMDVMPGTSPGHRILCLIVFMSIALATWDIYTWGNKPTSQVSWIDWSVEYCSLCRWFLIFPIIWCRSLDLYEYFAVIVGHWIWGDNHPCFLKQLYQSFGDGHSYLWFDTMGKSEFLCPVTFSPNPTCSLLNPW